jgi:hypothetical protein
MMRWLKFNMNQLGPVFGADIFKEQQGTTYQAMPCDTAFSPLSGKNYLAWFQGIHNFAPGKTFLWKNGSCKGFTSYIAFENWLGVEPQSALGVFVLANFPGPSTSAGDYGNAAQYLGRWILKYLCTGDPASLEEEQASTAAAIGQIPWANE